MSESSPFVLSQADEQFLQKVRDELLPESPALPQPALNLPAQDGAAAPEQPAGSPPAARQSTPPLLRGLAVSLGIAAAALSALEWWDPQAFQGCKVWGSLLLLFLGVGWLWDRGKRLEAAKKLPPQPLPLPTAFWPRLLNSTLWFVLVGFVLFTPLNLLWLVAVIALHEAGHYAGMLLFGYRDLKMFFIPGLGGAVQGEKKGVPAWQEAIVLLLGPLPGLVLGCLLYFVDMAIPLPPFLRTGAGWLVTLNLLNLLPFEPLDGGKLCWRLLFSRFRWLETITLALGAVGLLLVCVGPYWIILTLGGAFALLVLAPFRYRMATAAAGLRSRWPHLPSALADLSEDQWRDLFVTAKSQLKPKKPFEELTERQARVLTDGIKTQAKLLHARALVRPESGPVTLMFLAVYLAAVLLAIVTASVTNLRQDAEKWPIRIQRPDNPP